MAVHKKRKKLKLGFLPAIFSGVISGLFTCVVLILLISTVFSQSQTTPNKFFYYFMLLCPIIGSFFSGYVSAYVLKEKGMILGLISSFLMFVFIFFVGLIFSGENLSIITFIRFVSMLISGAVGGIISVNKKKKNKIYL